MLRLFFAILLTMTVYAVPSVAADAFVSVIEDLPLMEGLVENENAAVSFDSAGGRIAEAEARGDVSTTAVGTFYESVLPQLGWTRVRDGVYVREGEQLKLVIEADGAGGAVVAFSVSPEGR